MKKLMTVKIQRIHGLMLEMAASELEDTRNAAMDTDDADDMRYFEWAERDYKDVRQFLQDTYAIPVSAHIRHDTCDETGKMSVTAMYDLVNWITFSGETVKVFIETDKKFAGRLTAEYIQGYFDDPVFFDGRPTRVLSVEVLDDGESVRVGYIDCL